MDISIEKYGIEGIRAIGQATDSFYALYEQIYGDDQKITGDDLFDLFTVGPDFLKNIVTAAQQFRHVGDELTDLSETEKLDLQMEFGERVNHLAWQKIFKGVIELTDGVVELVQKKAA